MFNYCITNRLIFCHFQLYVQLASDAVLKPLKRFADSALADDYPPTRAGNIGAGIND
jgi:hypothetical protein